MTINFNRSFLVAFLFVFTFFAGWLMPTAVKADSGQQEINNSASCQTIAIFSDTSNLIIGGANAVATYNNNVRWTAQIDGSTWIWKTYLVENPTQDEITTFIKTFEINGQVQSALLKMNADNSYKFWVNDVLIGEDNTELNYFVENQHSYDIKNNLINGTNTIKFEVKNLGSDPDPMINPAGLLYRLDISSCPIPPPVINTPPMITLIGSSTMEIVVGQTFVDPGATAQDTEDGNLTNGIVVSGTISTSTPATYLLTYSVTDSGGLSASTTRNVVVNQPITPPPPSSTNVDIAISKTVDKVAPLQNSTIHYTLIASAIGPATSTAVTVTDLLPGSLTFVNATSSFGSYASSTGLWTIGDMTESSTATLVLEAIVNAQAGVTIINTATINQSTSSTDPDTSNNTATSTIVVGTPDSGPSGCGSQCGGGENPPTTTPPIGNGPPSTVTPPPTPDNGTTTPAVCNYLLEFLKIGENNNPVEVRKLQIFLRDFEGFSNVEVTGFFDQKTFDAVSAFQKKYSSDVLEPWGLDHSTSYVYITTKKKINEIYCQKTFPLTNEQLNEISAFKNRPKPELGTSTTTPSEKEVGMGTTTTPVVGMNQSSTNGYINNNFSLLASPFFYGFLPNGNLWYAIILIAAIFLIWLIYFFIEKRREKKREQNFLFFPE